MTIEPPTEDVTAPPTDQLDDLSARLEMAANQLRSGELAADQAAGLVEECARLASAASTELDRLIRAGEQ